MVKNILTIAGFDGSGGAGIQADLKTFHSHGCYGCSVLTAIPIQNTKGVTEIHELEPKFVERQLESIFSDIKFDAIKIGMLFSEDIIAIIEKIIKKYVRLTPVILDPVMIATSGDALLNPSAIKALVQKLFPLSTIITPNLNEARQICSLAKSDDELLKSIILFGSEYVLLKGGHSDSDIAIDILIDKDMKKTFFKAKRVMTNNTHGTGCTLSAAIAANLANGLNIIDSVAEAKKYVTLAIKESDKLKVGQGSGPVNHLIMV